MSLAEAGSEKQKLGGFGGLGGLGGLRGLEARC